MLFNLLLANTRILSCFYLFLVVLSVFLIIPVVKQKIKVRLALAVRAGVPITVVKKIDNPPIVAENN